MKTLARLTQPAAWVPALLVLSLAGCPGGATPKDEDDSGPAPPAAGVALRVAVIDDAALAAAVKRRRGEWQALSQGSLEVVELPHDALEAPTPFEADIVIYPSRFLGTLAAAGRIVPVRRTTLESEAYAAGDLLPVFRQNEVHWGEDVLAIPFGSPPLVLYYRTDLLDALGEQPPRTWNEYALLVNRLKSRPEGVKSATWHAAAEPNGKSWNGRMLLARAAAYARHDDQYSTLFNIDTMEPLIAGPPFARALAEYAAVKESRPVDIDSNRARKLIYQGEVALAITWPTAAVDLDIEDPPPVGISPLPGSDEVYDLQSGDWDSTDDEPRQACLLGCRGRLGSVTASCRNVPSALRLLAWLASPEVSLQIAPTSAATTLFRGSHMKAASRFAERQLPPEAAAVYADVLSDAVVQQPVLLVPRIPGIDEYLAALDEGIRQAVINQATPQQALDQVAEAWNAITARRGKQQQRAAYRQSLGLAP